MVVQQGSDGAILWGMAMLSMHHGDLHPRVDFARNFTNELRNPYHHCFLPFNNNNNKTQSPRSTISVHIYPTKQQLAMIMERVRDMRQPFTLICDDQYNRSASYANNKTYHYYQQPLQHLSPPISRRQLWQTRFAFVTTLHQPNT